MQQRRTNSDRGAKPAWRWTRWFSGPSLGRPLGLAGAILLFAALVRPAFAQWITQSFDLAPGWNAIYTHVDATSYDLDTFVGGDGANPIQQVWLWQPAAATAQFVTSPQDPTSARSQWVKWDRSFRSGAPSRQDLPNLPGNAAMLVLVGSNTNYTWQVKGRAVPPNYLWTSTGLNFIGFPTPAGAAPTFESFLATSPALYNSAEIFGYYGGELGADNPRTVFNYRSAKVTRGKAFWIRSGSAYNNYFGPFQLTLDNSAGLKFGQDLSQVRFRLRNLTSSPLSITLNLLHSENPPAPGAWNNNLSESIAGVPPLLLRGALNTTDLTYGFADLAAGDPQTIALAPSDQIGAETEVVIGLNRSQMGGVSGNLYSGILRLTDSLGLSQVDLPAVAETASRVGLWVGDASVNSVNQYLKNYQTNLDGTLLTTSDGAYVASGTNVNPAAVPKPFPLRLIIFNSGSASYLLQRAYQGMDRTTNLVVATQERFLHPGMLASARRITCAHLPWSADNSGWTFNRTLDYGSPLRVVVLLAYDDQSSNPFLHTYHPDHSGMDLAGINKLDRGMHAYDITRQITLQITSPAADFASLTADSNSLQGNYSEEVTLRGIGSNLRTFYASGQFQLRRINNTSAFKNF